jgi:hypothetical protein
MIREAVALLLTLVFVAMLILNATPKPKVFSIDAMLSHNGV